MTKPARAASMRSVCRRKISRAADEAALVAHEIRRNEGLEIKQQQSGIAKNSYLTPIENPLPYGCG